MNTDVMAEIDRLVTRTQPEMPKSPLGILAKFVYLDAIRIAEEAGNDVIADALRARLAFKADEDRHDVRATSPLTKAQRAAAAGPPAPQLPAPPIS